MGKKTYVCRVSRDPSKMLDDHCGPRTDCLAQLYAALEPMHSAAQEIAGRDVCLRGWPYIVSAKFDIEGRSLYDRQRLPRLKDPSERRQNDRFGLSAGRISAPGFRTGYARDRPSRKSMQAQIADDGEDQQQAFSAPTEFALRRDTQLSARRRHLRPHRR